MEQKGLTKVILQRGKTKTLLIAFVEQDFEIFETAAKKKTTNETAAS